MGKFDKKDVCEYCGEPMEAKQRNKRFCSDRCRVYWNRENNPIKKILSAKVEKENGKPVAKFVLEVDDKVFVSPMPKVLDAKPVRLEGEDAIDYAGRVSEWKKSLNK